MAKNSVSLHKRATPSCNNLPRSAANDSCARKCTAEQIARALEVATNVAADVARDAVVGVPKSDRGREGSHRFFHRAPIGRGLRTCASRARQGRAKAAFFRKVLVTEPLQVGEGRAQIFYLGGIVSRRRFERRGRMREHRNRRHRLSLCVRRR